MNCSKIGHSYEAFAYPPVLLKYLHSSSVSKQAFSCRSFKMRSHGKFRINLRFYKQVSYRPRKKWIVRVSESRINLVKFPVIANFKRSTGEILFAERRRMKIFRPNRYANASFICKWPILAKFSGSAAQPFLATGTLHWLAKHPRWPMSGVTQVQYQTWYWT